MKMFLAQRDIYSSTFFGVYVKHKFSGNKW